MTRARLAKGSSKVGKGTAGRPSLEELPVTLRSPMPLGAGFKNRIRMQLASRAGHAVGAIERVTVRFIDVNGPRGGVDTVCRIKVVMSNRPSILVEKRAHSYDGAFASAVRAIGTAIDRTHTKHQVHPRPRAASRAAARPRTPRSTAARTTTSRVRASRAG